MIKDKLKEIRENTGMNKKDFANYINTKYTTYNGYETGAREPDSDFLILISKKFDVSIDYILGLQDEKEILHSYQLKSIEYDHIKKYRDLDSHGKESVNITLDRESQRVTVLRDLQKQIPPPTDEPNKPNKLYLYTYLQKIACAGIGFYFADIPTDVIEAPYIHGADFIIGVNGDSMEPDFHDGERLYVQKVRELTLGDTGIFTIGNECFVKELGDKGLVSKNFAYEEIPGTEDVRLIGRVLGKLEE